MFSDCIPEKVQISNGRLVILPDWQNAAIPLPARKKREKDAAALKKEENLKDNTPGSMSKGVSRRMRKIIENWTKAVYIDKAKMLTFVTLTLPAKQFHTDKELNKLALKRLLDHLSKKGKFNHYLWRAEVQANGNIHWHLLLDNFIHWEYIRNYWNKIMADLGYIDRYRNEQKEKHKNGFNYDEKLFIQSKRKFNRTRQKQAYLVGLASDWSNPNSTDIHRLKSIRNPSAYIAKYCTKENSKKVELRPLECRIWGCSDVLKNLENPVIYEAKQNISDFLEAVKETAVKVVSEDYFTVVYSNDLSRIISEHPAIKRELYRHFRNIYQELYPHNFRKKQDQLFVTLDYKKSKSFSYKQTELIF